MYAVIRAGGKQYRVAPGDVIRVEKAKQPSASGSAITFNDVLAVSASDGQIARPSGEARVTGRVVEEGRADKVLVFHYKRKKQYKKLAGHRQPFTAVRITEITFDGQRFTAPEEPVKAAKPKKAKPEGEEGAEETSEKATPKVKAQASEGGTAKKTAGRGNTSSQAKGAPKKKM